MARGKFMMLMVSLILGGLTGLKAQSKKEVIQMLAKQVDSLQKVVTTKSESLQQLEVKLARAEGAAQVNDGFIRRMELKTDSLREALISRNTTIEDQKAQIAKLTADVTGFQNQEKDLTSKNEALMAELKAFKEKPDAAAAAVKESKVAVAEVPKETKTVADVTKPTATTTPVPVSKTEP